MSVQIQLEIRGKRSKQPAEFVSFDGNTSAITPRCLMSVQVRQHPPITMLLSQFPDVFRLSRRDQTSAGMKAPLKASRNTASKEDPETGFDVGGGLTSTRAFKSSATFPGKRNIQLAVDECCSSRTKPFAFCLGVNTMRRQLPV